MTKKTTSSQEGLRIVHEVFGEGNLTLVFVHGWTCNRTHWEEQVSEYADQCRVIVLDLIGHGESDLGRETYSMPNFATDVVSVIDAESVERCVLVGHSMGGMVILHAARMLGNRVRGVVGADTFKFLKDDPAVGKQSQQWEQMTKSFETATNSFVSSMFSDDTSDVLRTRIMDGMLNVNREVALGAMKGMADDIALLETAKSLEMPKFAFNATNRPMDVDAATEAGIEVTFLPTEGHFVMNEDPAGFNKLLDSAIETIRMTAND